MTKLVKTPRLSRKLFKTQFKRANKSDDTKRGEKLNH
jgi:hypothetical protein